MIVSTGGGAHVYWGLLDPLLLPADEQVARRLLRGLAMKFGGDLEVGEPARILRPPGTRNLKYSPARLVALELCVPERRYLADDLLIPTARTVSNWLRQFTQATLAPLIQLNHDLVIYERLGFTRRETNVYRYRP